MTPSQGVKNRIYSRELLTSNRTYYVRTDGNDSNDGLTNTSSGAFLTLQGAMNKISTAIDSSGYNVTIQVADGTYTSGCVLKDIVGSGGTGVFFIRGNPANSSNVVISSTSSNAISSSNLSTYWNISDMKLTSSAGNCIAALKSTIAFYNINFGSCAANHLNSTYGGYIQAASNYTISGSAANSHVYVNGSGSYIWTVNKTVTIAAPVSFLYFSFATFCSVHYGHGMTFSISGGSVTGTRYSGTYNSATHTNGGGANYFPGSISGSVSAGGIYV